VKYIGLLYTVRITDGIWVQKASRYFRFTGTASPPVMALMRTLTAPQLPNWFGELRLITDTKKPAGLVPCGLSGLLRMALEASLKNFGGWRNLKKIRKIMYLFVFI